MPKKALITGITGQDGSYLAEFLLLKGYEVHGLIRRSSTPNLSRIQHLLQDVHDPSSRFFLHYGDLGDSSSLTNLCYTIKPEEVYNLGAQSHVRVSFEIPENTGDVTALSTTRLLEAIRKSGIETRFYQASSSEMFGSSLPPQNENTKFHPRSPYAISKVYSYWTTINYREAYDMYACNGILFNHESPRRGSTFVTRKITSMLANILIGKQNKIFLGNLDAKRDWGFAPEYVEAMYLMLQLNEPEDFVLGTGESHSVREFLEIAFTYVGIELGWQGKGSEEIGIVKSLDPAVNNLANIKSGDSIIEIDPWYFRPSEVDFLLADISKAKQLLDWEPKIGFTDLVKIMVDFDLKNSDIPEIGEGINILKSEGINWTTNESEVSQV